jgi:hypothetical protein
MDRNSIQRSACGRSLSAQRIARSRGCRKLLFDDRVGLSASPEDRQPDRGYDQNHQSNDSLNWLYPGLVESHAQSAYDYREHNRKVGLREHVVSTGLLNLCKAQRRGGDLSGICQRRPGNRRAGQVLVIHRPSPIPAVLAVLAVPAASTGSPFWVADSVPEPLFLRVPFPACQELHLCFSPGVRLHLANAVPAPYVGVSGTVFFPPRPHRSRHRSGRRSRIPFPVRVYKGRN